MLKKNKMKRAVAHTHNTRGQFGLAPRRVTKGFMLKHGPGFNLLRTRGLRMVQMRVAYGCEDNSPESHRIAYDGVSLKGNGRCSTKMDEMERCTTIAPHA